MESFIEVIVTLMSRTGPFIKSMIGIMPTNSLFIALYCSNSVSETSHPTESVPL